MAFFKDLAKAVREGWEEGAETGKVLFRGECPVCQKNLNLLREASPKRI